MSCFCLIRTPADTHNTPPPPHTHTHTHARAHTNTHTHIHKHTRQISNRLNDMLRFLSLVKSQVSTHTQTRAHTQACTVHTNTQPPQTCVCMCVHEVVCVRVCLGVCYLLCAYLFTWQKHGNVRVVLETSHLKREIFFLTMYDVENCHICDLTIVRKMLSIKNYSTESGFFFWYQFFPRKLLYHVVSVDLVKFGPHWLSVFLGGHPLYIYIMHSSITC